MPGSKLLFTGCLLFGAALARIATAETVCWEVATPFPEASKPQAALEKAAKRLARSSGETVRVHFAGRDPGPGVSMLGVLSADDDIDAALVPGTEFAAIDPDAGLYAQFFAFTDLSDVAAVRRSLDTAFLSYVQTDDHAVIGILGLGFLHLMSDSRFTSVKELAGQEVLVPAYSDLYGGLFTAMKLVPRTGITDAPPAMILTSLALLILDDQMPRLDYIVLPPVQYVYLVLVAKRSRWEGLPPGRRSAIESMLVEEMSRMQRNGERTAARASRVLSKQGMRNITLPAEDMVWLREVNVDQGISPRLQAEFRAALAGSGR